MANYIEYIKSGSSGVPYAVRDVEAHDAIDQQRDDLDATNTRIDALATEIGNMSSNILSVVYPVGSIYMSVNNVSPEALFGGTWEQLKDRFLLSAGDVYTAGTTGGEAEHVLTIDEMPAHSHGYLDYWSASPSSSVNHFVPALNGDGNGIPEEKLNERGKTADAGGGLAHNNMPPYLAVYMWKRTE